MEKILRKVKCSERLPDKEGNYIAFYKTKYSPSPHENYATNFYYAEGVKEHILEMYEYWYEEVDISTLMAQSVADLFTEEDKQNYRKATEKAIEKERKERYEKAMELINDNLWCNSLGDEHCYIKYIKEALKIAAGLQEE